MSSVLLVGKNTSALLERNEQLSSAGWETVSTSPQEQGLEAARQKEFDVAIFQADIPQAERNQFASQLKQLLPQLCLIFLYEQQIFAAEQADAVLNSAVSAQDLSMTIRYLMGMRNSASA